MFMRPTIRGDAILRRGLGTSDSWGIEVSGDGLVLLRLIRGDGVIDIWGRSY